MELTDKASNIQALARAVYSRIGVLVLDNVLSGVDSKNIAIISRKLLEQDGYFRMAGISVVLAMTTCALYLCQSRPHCAYHHDPAANMSLDEMLPLADRILLMQDGKISAFGSYDEIISRDPQIAVKVQKVERKVPIKPIIEVSKCCSEPVEIKQESKIEAQFADNESTTGIKQQGPGPGSVYKYYIRSAGSSLVVAFLAFTLIEAFCNSFQSKSCQLLGSEANFFSTVASVVGKGQ